MSKGRRGPNLFEVMNKSPLTQNPRPRLPRWPWQRGGTEEGPTCVVAEALTEEEAAAELAAEAEQRQRQKEKAQRVRLAAKQAAEEAENREKDKDQEQNTDPLVQASGGRLVLSLNTVACVAAAASICILVLGAYSFGRRSMGASPGDGLSPVAAVTPSGSEASPLLPSTDRAKASGGAPSEGNIAAFSQTPNVDQLLERPSVFDESRVVANQPASVERGPREAPLSRRLNYLQIESFRVTRDRNGEQLRQDLADVRLFLAKHGVPTLARQLRSGGYCLFSEHGIPPGDDYEAQRVAYMQKVSQLGKTYRREGGLYEFKGCLFVSHSTATTGESVR